VGSGLLIEDSPQMFDPKHGNLLDSSPADDVDVTSED